MIDTDAASVAAFLDAFGVRSETFSCARTALATAVDVWLPALGASLSDQDDTARELFLRRIYFALVARMLAWRALICVDERAGRFVTPGAGGIARVLTGEWFATFGLANYPGDDGCLEPHLCGQPAVLLAGSAVAERTAACDVPALGGGALADLYQQLLSASDRRGLGEFYTPDGLARRIAARALDAAGRPDAALCDPTCGSGVFLAAAIRAKRARLADGPAALACILRTVRGADVQPLAVLAAKTSYLIALVPLLAAAGQGSLRDLRLPVAEADLLGAGETAPSARCDIVVGNPPWQPVRALPPERQAALRRLAAEYGLLSGRGEMAPHLDLAALCVARAADRLLVPGGQVAMVLPRTVLHADQHDTLRRGIRLPGDGTLRWREAWDCERLDAFPVPACVLFAERTSGTEAQQAIRVERPGTAAAPLVTHLCMRGARSFWEAEGPAANGATVANPYRERFRQGATLVPRSFWFVRAADTEVAGPGARVVAVETAETARAGPVAAYRDFILRGCVPVERIYATALGDDLLPFGLRRLRTVLLPIEPHAGGYRVMTAREASARGEWGLAQWLEQAERAWSAARGQKAGRMSVYERLDRMRGLSGQNPRARFRVVYPNFQRIAIAAVVDTAETLATELGGPNVRPAGFIADTALYACETDDAGEAHYLCACLNAAAIDRRLGALRRREQRSHPNVHKKLFDTAPIPPYDPARAAHRRLAALAEACAARVRSAVAERAPDAQGAVGLARQRIRDRFAPELAELDGLTEEVLSAP